MAFISVTGSEGLTIPWGLAVMEGGVPGWHAVERSGANPEIDTGTVPETLWDGGGLYTYSTTADIDTLSSSDPVDTQTLLVEGLDANWDVVTQYAILTGTTKVTLTTPLIRLFQITNIGATNIAGTVYCYVDCATTTPGVPDVVANIRGEILDGNNITRMAMWTCPAGHEAHFFGGSSQIIKTGDRAAVVAVLLRLYGGVFTTRIQLVLNAGAASDVSREFFFPTGFPEKTDVEFRCTRVTANGTGIEGRYAAAYHEV